MEENRASYVRTVAFMFVGGAVLGAVAGVLLAPKSGEATRKDITDYASKVKGEVVEGAQRSKAGFDGAGGKARGLLCEFKAAYPSIRRTGAGQDRGLACPDFPLCSPA